MFSSSSSLLFEMYTVFQVLDKFIIFRIKVFFDKYILWNSFHKKYFWVCCFIKEHFNERGFYSLHIGLQCCHIKFNSILHLKSYLLNRWQIAAILNSISLSYKLNITIISIFKKTTYEKIFFYIVLVYRIPIVYKYISFCILAKEDHLCTVAYVIKKRKIKSQWSFCLLIHFRLQNITVTQ